MSWSFNGVGKPQAVLAKAKKEMTAYALSEPEQTIRGKCLKILEISLEAMPEDTAVDVKMSGSQSIEHSPVDNKPTGKATNTLRVDIQPIYGFIE